MTETDNKQKVRSTRAQSMVIQLASIGVKTQLFYSQRWLFGGHFAGQRGERGDKLYQALNRFQKYLWTLILWLIVEGSADERKQNNKPLRRSESLGNNDY